MFCAPRWTSSPGMMRARSTARPPRRGSPAGRSSPPARRCRGSGRPGVEAELGAVAVQLAEQEVAVESEAAALRHRRQHDLGRARRVGRHARILAAGERLELHADVARDRGRDHQVDQHARLAAHRRPRGRDEVPGERGADEPLELQHRRRELAPEVAGSQHGPRETVAGERRPGRHHLAHARLVQRHAPGLHEVGFEQRFGPVDVLL